MPRDPMREADTTEWLAKAEFDLRAARFEMTAQPPLTADIVFHCQQAAEKSMKAFLVWHDLPFRKTHNLVEIGEQCTRVDPALEDVMRQAAVLTEYAWKFRCPGEPLEPPVPAAAAALALAEDVYGAVVLRLRAA